MLTSTVSAHLARAAVMAPAMAHIYLAHLHAGATRQVDLARDHDRNPVTRAQAIDSATRAAVAYQNAAIDRRLGVLDVANAERQVAPMPLTEPTFAHPVANPHWPALATGHGVYVMADDRTSQKPSRGWWVELHVYAPDADRSQLVVKRQVASAADAVTLAGRWAAMGMAIVEAEGVVEAGERAA